MTKRAVIVGVNDYSHQNSLPAGWSVGNLNCCVADATSMRDLLTSAFLFDTISAFLVDGAATRDAILQATIGMLSASGPGDVACLVYSGHGGRFPADPTSSTRYYECMIPAAGSPITDLDMYNLANSLDPSVANFTLILDSCHSGGLHEGTPDSTIRSVAYSPGFVATCVSSMNTVVPCGITLPPGSGQLDGNVSGVVGQGNGVVCSVDDNKSLVPASRSTVLAACRYDEDALEQNGHGALTQGILNSVIASNPSTTYLQMVDSLRSQMFTLNVSQTPTLLGQEDRMGEVFLAPWNTSA